MIGTSTTGVTIAVESAAKAVVGVLAGRGDAAPSCIALSADATEASEMAEQLEALRMAVSLLRMFKVK